VILSDFDLMNYIKSGRLVIEPFSEAIVRENGVDLRLGDEIARLIPSETPLDTNATEMDLSTYFRVERGDSFIIRPYEKVLLTTLERVRLPNDVMAFVELRSSFARLGLTLPPTIVDAGFEGNITLEVEGSAFPIKLHKGQRFAHVIFAKTLNPVERPYRGRYQGQEGVTLPKLKGLR
jgi:dCTP deaminase